MLFKSNFGNNFDVQKNECCLSVWVPFPPKSFACTSELCSVTASLSITVICFKQKLNPVLFLNSSESSTLSLMALHHFIWQRKEKYIWAPLSWIYPKVILCQVLYVTIAARCHWDLWRLVWKIFTVELCTSFNAFLSVTPLMELKPNAGSDRAWVWNTHADFADECPKPELLAIRFLNAESEWTGTELMLILDCYVTLRVWALL